jgi:probable O-glycosylation ligase (exosortase A-associated)
MQLEARARPPGPAPGWWRPAEAAAPPADARGSPAAFGALAVFTFVLLLAPQERYPALAPLRLAAVSAGTAALAHAWGCRRKGRRLLAPGGETTLGLALVGWAAVTVPFSLWPGGSLDLLTGVFVKSVAVFLLLGAVIDSERRLHQLAWSLSLLAVPLAATALSNFASGELIDGARGAGRIVGYVGSLTENPNDLALLLNLILPLTVALFFSHRGALVRTALAAAVALDVAAVVATFSRAGFLTLAVVFAALLWKLRRRAERVWPWGALAVALSCTALLPGGYLERLGTITSVSSDPTGSAQDRARDMLAAVEVVLDRPVFGAGLGMNVLALNAERGATWRSVHNVYLQYAADLGLPGLALFLALFASCLVRAGRTARILGADRARGRLLHLAEGVQLSLIGFAVAACFHPVGYLFPFFYVAGLAVAVRGIAAGSER